MLFIILAIVIFISAIIVTICDDKKRNRSRVKNINLATSLLVTIMASLAISVFLFVVMCLIGIFFLSSNTVEKTQVTEKLYSVDATTLNGRSYYIAADDNNIFYITREKDGSTKINTVNAKDIKIFEDEEVEPYISHTMITTTQKDYSWYIPFSETMFSSGKPKNTMSSPELHIPLQSISYGNPE